MQGIFKGLNESPSQKEGKFGSEAWSRRFSSASMKALPRRKGNLACGGGRYGGGRGLNESPSQKEGKSKNTV